MLTLSGAKRLGTSKRNYVRFANSVTAFHFFVNLLRASASPREIFPGGSTHPGSPTVYGLTQTPYANLRKSLKNLIFRLVFHAFLSFNNLIVQIVNKTVCNVPFVTSIKEIP